MKNFNKILLGLLVNGRNSFSSNVTICVEFTVHFDRPHYLQHVLEMEYC